MKDELIRDRLVSGILNDNVRKILLPETDLTLTKAIHICQIHELSDSDAQSLRSAVTRDEHVHVVKTRHFTDKPWRAPHRDADARPKGGHFADSRRNPVFAQPKCGNCGRNHANGTRSVCPAFGKQCNKCGRRNHFAVVCRSSAPPSRTIQEVQQEDYDEDEDSYFYIETINEHGKKDDIHAELTLNGVKTRLKVDTGAKCNVMGETTLKRIHGKPVDMTKRTRLIRFGGQEVKTLGVVKLPCVHGRHKVELAFHVVRRDVTTLLGLKDSLCLELITLSPDVFEVQTDEPASKPIISSQIPEGILMKYSDLFDDAVGKLPVKYKITVDPDVPPMVRPVRTVPMAVRGKLKEKLDQMVVEGIIAPVSEPTDWVSAMVVATKKSTGELRVCIDPGDLNKAIKRPHYPMCTIEQVIQKFPNVKYFTVLDARQAFYHIPLDDRSSYLTTFGTPFGRYRYLRMPMGIRSAPEVYQQAIEQLMANAPCEVIMHDIIIPGTNDDNHDSNVIKVLDRLREINLKLALHKIQYKQRSVKYSGHIVSDGGLKPDPAKVKAIVDMPTPQNTTDLLRFMGMVKYLTKFVPNVSETAAPLNALLRKDHGWQWDTLQRQAFEYVKRGIAEATTLAYFDVNKEVTLTCDASKSGLGVACLQEGKPVIRITSAHQR